MRSIVMTATAAAVLFLSAVETSEAFPIAPAAGAHVQQPSDIQKARVYCYSTVTGAFLHWGSCGRHYYYRPIYRRHYRHYYYY
jgi:hypothetical protein